MPTSHIDIADQQAAQTLDLKKILVPLDFSAPSKQAFQYALQFARQFGAELTLIHILSRTAPSFADLATVPSFSERELDDTEKNMTELVAVARAAQLAATRWTLRIGLPAHEIVEAAKELDVDLIVIATHGYTGWKHFCIGSTAERVVRAAPCPVFVVREKEHQFNGMFT
ncbi:MAG TPA: universal stress protein [Chthoniobacterales bacterium]|nr:universal stress protein [Chthoniobacterales bacterium]